MLRELYHFVERRLGISGEDLQRGEALQSWEDAVRWYRSQPGQERAILDNYFDLPVGRAIERFEASEEFKEVSRLLGPGAGRRVLDFGAGNGIASIALAASGWTVTSLEPDPSSEVGNGAVRSVARDRKLDVRVIDDATLPLPVPAATFDAIHARQVMHHVPDVRATAREFARITRSGGLILVTREHVVDNWLQKQRFLESHPLHRFYGGENAYPLRTYLKAFRESGLRVVSVWGPAESILNFFPGSEAARTAHLDNIVDNSFRGAGVFLSGSARFRAGVIRRATRRDRAPGRLYSFLLER
jgi:SAM-dependent methyltransferase